MISKKHFGDKSDFESARSEYAQNRLQRYELT